MKLRSIFRTALQLALVSCTAFGAHAAEPTTRLIVGFQAGGGLDSVARSLADAINRTGSHKVIVENRPGASGIIGIDAVRNAKPSDSMLLIVPSSSIAMTPHTNPHFSYNPEQDLVPVARVAMYTLGLAVPAASGATTVGEFLQTAKKDKTLAAYGTAGVGLSPHYVGVTLATAADVDLVHVPYKGAGPAINDTLGNQIPAVISTTPSLLGLVRDGRLKLLATSGNERDLDTPDTPTFKELGYAGIEIEEWFGVLAPAGTSQEEAERWNAAINEALESEALRKTLLTQGFAPAPMSQPDFRKLVLSDYEAWREALKDTGDTFAN
jgi:tripartite-type tricarboxylate transporter receptor subunit TctC